MSGRVIVVEGYTKPLILGNPTTLFAFSDNLAKLGFIEQSAAARGCANAVGIPTKISPDKHIFDDMIGKPILGVDFAYDGAYGYIINEVVKSFVRLRDHLRSGGNVAWPKGGVGTGESRLNITAPLLLQGIEASKALMFSEASSVTHESY